MRPSRILSGALACALLLGACNDSADPEPPPLPGDAQNEPDGDEEDNTESDEIDVSTVPDDPEDIDEAYLETVLKELGELFVAAAVVYQDVGNVDDANVQSLVFAAYTEAAGGAQLNALSHLGPEAISDDPSPPTTEVREIVDRGPECVFLTAERDFSPALTPEADYDPVQPYYLRLHPHEPDDINPTAWQLDYDGFLDEPVEVEEGDGCDV